MTDSSLSCVETHESLNSIEKQIFNYEKELSVVYESAANFIIKLHTYSNFAKSDVYNIKNNLEDLILKPILNFLGQTQNPNNPINKTMSEVLHDVQLLFSSVRLPRTLIYTGDNVHH